MKIDLDAIFYIILSIIILIISGLGSRRKKLTQPMKRSAPSVGQSPGQGVDEMEMRRSRQPVPDPFARLEQILTGQSPYETLEGESLEVIEDEEEMIVKEEEKVMVSPVTEGKPAVYDTPLKVEGKTVKRTMDDLFGDMDEITRAIIYSEILPRRYG